MAASRQAIERRLAPLRDRADGVLFVEPAGPHFCVVIKKGSHLRMLLAEQVAPRTELTQAHLDLERPLYLVAPYTQAMALGVLWPQEVRRVYAAGLGGGRLPLVLHHFLPLATIDCAEIEPVVLEAAERYFGFRRDERLRVAIEDGREWLATLQDERRYDLMLIDVFLDNGYSPYRMATREFYALARERLTADGVVVINLLATDPYLADKVSTMQAVFPEVALCPAGDENRVLFASAKPLPGPEWLAERARTLQATLGSDLDLGGWVTALSPAEMSGGSVLLDSTPPPDYFDPLPSFDGAFGKMAPELPCPCGSGKRFATCHGAPRPQATRS